MATESLLRAAAQERGYHISGDGRVSEAHAADLLGVATATLKWWRQCGTGPRCMRVGGRVTYRLCDLAEFIHAGGK